MNEGNLGEMEQGLRLFRQGKPGMCEGGTLQGSLELSILREKKPVDGGGGWVQDIAREGAGCQVSTRVY